LSELTTLSNGLRVYADPMPGLRSSTIGVWFHAGAIDETKSQHGIAHLLEHMAFKGTTTRSARAIAEEIENVGGYLNASTGYSRTGYYARILEGDEEKALEILADILTNPTFDAAELAKEREVVVQEIGEAADIPDDVAMEMLQRVSFGEHALGRPILGAIESVRRHDRASLGDFMSEHYAPQDTVIAASGAIAGDHILKLAEKYFSGRPKFDRAARTDKPIYIGGSDHDARASEQTHVALAFPGVSVRDEDYFATRIFVEALGGGMSSRIFQSVREERGLAYSVYAFTDAYEDVGAIGAYVGTDEGNAIEAASLIRDEIKAMADAPTEKEIERARTMLRSTLLMGLENPATRAETAVGQLFAHGRLINPVETVERLEAVGLEAVKRVAARALSDTASVVAVGPVNFSKLHDVCKAS